MRQVFRDRFKESATQFHISRMSASNLFVNGGLEKFNIPTDPCGSETFCIIPSRTLADWKANTDIEMNHEFDPIEGVFCSDLNAYEMVTLSQSFKLKAGTYTLSFWATANTKCGPENKTGEYSLAGNEYSFTRSSTDWAEEKQIIKIPSAGSYTFKVQSTVEFGCGPVVDNFSLIPSKGSTVTSDFSQTISATERSSNQDTTASPESESTAVSGRDEELPREGNATVTIASISPTETSSIHRADASRSPKNSKSRIVNRIVSLNDSNSPAVEFSPGTYTNKTDSEHKSQPDNEYNEAIHKALISVVFLVIVLLIIFVFSCYWYVKRRVKKPNPANNVGRFSSSPACFSIPSSHTSLSIPQCLLASMPSIRFSQFSIDRMAASRFSNVDSSLNSSIVEKALE